MLDLDLLAPDKPRPLSRREYDALVDIGAFDDERAELLQGVVVAMTPSKAPHAFAIQELGRLLTRGLGDRAIVRTQLPLALSEDSEPEPDVAVVPAGDYRTAHPTTALLVVEVADSSLVKDRRIKGPIYAAAGVPEYWVVNLLDGVVEVHLDPVGNAYGRITTLRKGELLRPSTFADVSIDVAALLA